MLKGLGISNPVLSFYLGHTARVLEKVGELTEKGFKIKRLYSLTRSLPYPQGQAER